MYTRRMRSHVLGLSAACLLAVATGTASARSLSVSSLGFRVVFASLEFNGEGLAIIRCPVTIEGPWHWRTIAKTAGTLIGWVTTAAVQQERCTNGTASAFNGTERYNGTTTPNTLPWHLTYESYSGSLPTISAVQLLFREFRFGIRDSSSLCTGQYGYFTDNVTFSANLGEGGAMTSWVPIEGRNTATLYRRDGGIFCPNGRLRGSGAPTLAGSSFFLITVTLI